MHKSILKDLVVGGLYRHITTNRVFVLLQFEIPGSGLFDGRRRHLEAWKIMTDEKVESVWLWEGNYKKLECTPTHAEL